MIEIIIKRLKNLVDVALKPSFLTWLAITIIIIYNKQNLDLNYYIFTCGMVGMKLFEPKGAGNASKGYWIIKTRI